MEENQKHISKILKAAESIHEYCYTQDECDDCIFYDNTCTLSRSPMEWIDWFSAWEKKSLKK